MFSGRAILIASVSGGGALVGYQVSDIAAICGVFAGFATLAINWYFRKKKSDLDYKTYELEKLKFEESKKNAGK